MPTSTEGVLVTGAPYLELATALLQRARLAQPTGGIWEAADVQWWWRQERPTDQEGQLFWLDDRGDPLAAAIRTDFGHSVQCDVLVLADDRDLERAAWRAAIARADAVGTRAEFPVRTDDAAGIGELVAAGFAPAGSGPAGFAPAGSGPAGSGRAGFGRAGEAGVVACWLHASRRPPIPPLPGGYRLLSRADAPDRPHPMMRRNGLDVAERLGGCSLYRRELDLMVEGPDGLAAGYGLFWADPVTGVGLVEPMRTEDGHQRRGIASHILATGLDRLAAHGCRRLKVGNDLGIYLRAGFRPLPSPVAAIYTRPGASGHGAS
jgi:GNAT superfamily N-acetyltransferase